MIVVVSDSFKGNGTEDSTEIQHAGHTPGNYQITKIEAKMAYRKGIDAGQLRK